jgi:hypothetical protein
MDTSEFHGIGMEENHGVGARSVSIGVYFGWYHLLFLKLWRELDGIQCADKTMDGYSDIIQW